MRILILSYRLNEKGNMPKGLNSPNTFPRKDNKRITLQLVIKRTNFKVPIRLQLPPHLVSNIHWRNICSQDTDKVHHFFHLPIIKFLDKTNIPTPSPSCTNLVKKDSTKASLSMASPYNLEKASWKD